MEMKALPQSLYVGSQYFEDRYASLRRVVDKKQFCGGYMLTSVILAARAYCVFVK